MGALHKKAKIRAGHALRSPEGSATQRVARGEVPYANLVAVRLWNPLSREFDFVSLALSPWLRGTSRFLERFLVQSLARGNRSRSPPRQGRQLPLGLCTKKPKFERPCPPESGGQRDPEGRARGGSLTQTLYLCGFGTPSRASSPSSHSRCPPDSGGQAASLNDFLCKAWPGAIARFLMRQVY